MHKKIKVGIQALFTTGNEGGLEQTVIGLVNGLDALNDPRFEYYIIALQGQDDWIKPFVSENIGFIYKPVAVDPLDGFKNFFGRYRSMLGAVKRSLQDKMRQSAPAEVAVPTDSFYETLGLDVLHIIYPIHYVHTPVSTVFTIHDLQHRHFQQFFGSSHLQWRETVYPAAFKNAAVIVAICDWVRTDVMDQYHVPPEKLKTVYWSAVTQLYGDSSGQAKEQVIKKFALTTPFLLYPAVTYEHKNHIRLLHAVKLLRDAGHPVQLVCTGRQRHHWPQIENFMQQNNLGEAVKFLGFVPTSELKALYDLSTAVVLPTLFEGAGLPLLEAFNENKAVSCSNIPAFKEYGGDAALFFDPLNVADMAEKMEMLLINETLRKLYALKGLERIKKFTWQQTALGYNEAYERAATAKASAAVAAQMTFT